LASRKRDVPQVVELACVMDGEGMHGRRLTCGHLSTPVESLVPALSIEVGLPQASEQQYRENDFFPPTPDGQAVDQ
jgi:hypothetical protein